MKISMLCSIKSIYYKKRENPYYILGNDQTQGFGCPNTKILNHENKGVSS